MSAASRHWPGQMIAVDWGTEPLCALDPQLPQEHDTDPRQGLFPQHSEWVNGVCSSSCTVQGRGCPLHLRATSRELQLRARAWPASGPRAAAGADHRHLFEKCSIHYEAKCRMQKGACCWEFQDGSTAKQK